MALRPKNNTKLIFCDEAGFTSVGMGIALLLSLVLLVSGVRIYDSFSYADRVQAVADQAALAAQEPIADFCTCARACDASLLSLSVGGALLLGVGVVALCIPVAAEFGELCVEQGNRVLEFRDRLYEKMQAALDTYQKLLPFLSALKARELCEQSSTQGHAFQGFAYIFPLTGAKIELSHGDSGGLKQEVDQNKDEIKRTGAALEQALKEAEQGKEAAYQADCGAEPGYCMSERARSLALLAPTDNPTYVSPDTWPLAAGLERAQRYYRSRTQRLESFSQLEEQAREVLRHRFYEYAVHSLDSAYVREGEAGVETNLPRLPRNTEEMRGTSLYTDPVYPIVNDDGILRAHVWEGSVGSHPIVAYKSLQEIESEHIESCLEYDCSAVAMGKVAQASTSIDNGFEYHFRVYEEGIERYKVARDRAKPLEDELKGRAQGVFEQVRTFLKENCSKRIELDPPGKDGAVAFVFDSGAPKTSVLGTKLVQSQRQLGPSFAVAGSRLAPDTRPEAPSVIEVLSGSALVKEEGVDLFGAFGSLWTQLLKLYQRGFEGLFDLVDSLLAQVPFLQGSPVARGIAEQLKGLLQDCGFDPAPTELLKPALVNTRYVVEKAGDPVAQGMRQAQKSSESVSKHLSRNVADELKDQVSDAISSFAEGDASSIEILGFSLDKEQTESVTTSFSTELKPKDAD